MSVRWQEYDPYTGVLEINDASEDDWEIRTKRVQDVQPLLDRTKEARNTGSVDQASKELHLYCSIPMVVAYELLNKGINVFNPDHMPKVLEEVNMNYPHLRYTNKTHSLTPKRTATSLSVLQGSQKQEDSPKPGPSLIVR
jgi:hypothetical protein